jgi:hypothetical protein
MSCIEVDQSGKMERTQVNTALAFSDGVAASLLILATDKRECVRRLRRRGEDGHALYLKLFAAALFLLIADYLAQLEVITIDAEYPGHEAEIRAMLLNHVRKIAPTFSRHQIVFGEIGKKSPAHCKALAVYRGAEKPGKRIGASELLRLVA